MSVPIVIGRVKAWLTVRGRMDISFPASTLMLSDVFPRNYQGIAASLVTTVVNYSISIGLGIAGTVESRVNATGENVEGGFRAAMWSGVGLAGLGLCIALASAFSRHFTAREG